MTPAQRKAYRSGITAQQAGSGRNYCPFGYAQPVMRAYWLAGWHDADMGHAG